MPASTYSHYEDPSRHKAPYINWKMVSQFSRVLEPLGVPLEEINSLARPKATDGEGGLFDARFQELSERQQRILLDLVAEFEEASAGQVEPEEPDAERGEAP